MSQRYILLKEAIAFDPGIKPNLSNAVPTGGPLSFEEVLHAANNHFHINGYDGETYERIWLLDIETAIVIELGEAEHLIMVQGSEVDVLQILQSRERA